MCGDVQYLPISGMALGTLRLLETSLGWITILLLLGIGFGLGFGLSADSDMPQPWSRVAQVNSVALA